MLDCRPGREVSFNNNNNNNNDIQTFKFTNGFILVEH